jgi:hypothetical protein
MPDNKPIKDGLGNSFTVRMRDISPLTDGSLMRSMIYATPYPLDYGVGGFYQHCAKSGVMAAGMAAGAPIYSFRFTTASMIAAIERVRLSAWTSAALFAASMATFDLYAARSFTAPDTGGNPANFSGDYNQLRSSMGASTASIQCANTAALNAGTRTLDAAPLDSKIFAVPGTASTPIGTMTLFEKLQGDHPLILAQNEGFVVNATVPAGGTWQFALTLEWAELSNF